MSEEKEQNEIAQIRKRTTEVAIGDETCVVKPLVLDEYIELLDDMAKIGAELVSANPSITLESFDVSDMVMLFQIAPEAVRRFIGLSISKPPEWVGAHIDARALSEVVLAIVELNELATVLGNFGRLGQMLGIDLKMVIPQVIGKPNLSQPLSTS